MISTIVTFYAENDTLGAIRNLVTELKECGIESGTELLDGSHASLENISLAQFSKTTPVTIADLFAWVESFATLPPETIVVCASSITVDAPHVIVEKSCCGEHVDSLPANLYLTINKNCLTNPNCLP